MKLKILNMRGKVIHEIECYSLADVQDEINNYFQDNKRKRAKFIIEGDISIKTVIGVATRDSSKGLGCLFG